MWLITCRNRAAIYAICCVLTFLVYKFSIYQKIKYCQERLSQSSAVMIFIFIPKPFSALIRQSKVTFFCIILLTAQSSSTRFSHFDSHSTICSYFFTVFCLIRKNLTGRGSPHQLFQHTPGYKKQSFCQENEKRTIINRFMSLL